jgi:protein TonB
MPELKQPDPLPEPEPLKLDEPPPELLAETPEPPVVLPKPRPERPKPPRKIEPKPELPPEPAAAPAPAPPAPQPVQVASSPPAAPPRPAAPPPSYLAQLVAELERHKNYPRSAQSRRQQGTALLRFTLTRDGHVADWRIERSSGHESLDGAVAAMIRKADPLPPLPPEISGDRLDLVVPVSFVLR